MLPEQRNKSFACPEIVDFVAPNTTQSKIFDFRAIEISDFVAFEIYNFDAPNAMHSRAPNTKCSRAPKIQSL